MPTPECNVLRMDKQLVGIKVRSIHFLPVRVECNYNQKENAFNQCTNYALPAAGPFAIRYDCEMS